MLSLAAVLAGCRGSGREVELASPQVQSRPAPQMSPRPAPPTPTIQAPSLANRTVVVDAGHGGADPGAWDRSLSEVPEKTINLDIANLVAGLLRQRGAWVLMTRPGDQRVELQERADRAERYQADLFISIHANAAPSREPAGAEVYVCRAASSSSEQAAAQIEAALRRSGFACRGIRRANFVVLAGHRRPAVLLECGFLTNRDDARRLNDPACRRQLAAAIVDGVARYLLQEPRQGQPPNTLAFRRPLVP
jgi:N-acetylmuramoyl-L-alanine amidase